MGEVKLQIPAKAALKDRLKQHVSMSINMSVIKIGLAGVGKIAKAEHIPAIAQNPKFELIACASRNATVDNVPNFTSTKDMLNHCPEMDAVALCLPPQYRLLPTLDAMQANKHILVEKPPSSTLAEAKMLISRSQKSDKTFFMTWHSRYAASVSRLKEILFKREIDQCVITWKEDVRRWHPDQEWIWQPGGLGVFDPGINALSILTEILPFDVYVTKSKLFFPENRLAPIAAELTFSNKHRSLVRAEFDWRQEGDQIWNIEVRSGKDQFLLSHGGAMLHKNGVGISDSKNSEYSSIYKRFAELIETGKSQTDIAPSIHVADAFMRGEIIKTAPFLTQP